MRPLCPIIDRVHCCVLILLRNNFQNLFVGKEEEGFVCPWDQTGLGIPGFFGRKLCLYVSLREAGGSYCFS